MRRILGWIMIATFVSAIVITSIDEMGVIGALIFWVLVGVVAGWLYIASCLLID